MSSYGYQNTNDFISTGTKPTSSTTLLKPIDGSLTFDRHIPCNKIAPNPSKQNPDVGAEVIELQTFSNESKSL